MIIMGLELDNIGLQRRRYSIIGVVFIRISVIKIRHSSSRVRLSANYQNSQRLLSEHQAHCKTHIKLGTHICWQQGTR